ncbi:MAG: pyridoxal-dependent decarboxylase, exosortase A system-associated [Desulfobacterales bacterium RIFOXYA12_FULL_46_15]|nr:MAG: pyridoxal-dependent decarboxylase, exosortase A system-associated [Desulfobacterales bacterium RIFOXYA12_FULL_46_15]
MKDHKALKSILKYFRVKNGSLLIGGKTCKEIAEEIGTPFYVYDLSIAEKKYNMLRQALPSDVEIHYAIKANPHPEVLRFFQHLGCGADVASMGELNKALAAGILAKDIGFAGPGKTAEQLKAACESGIGSLNAESEQELDQADRVAGALDKKLNVALRINPAFELTASGMHMGGGPKAFGIDEELIPKILGRFSSWKNLNFIGFHIFAGSQNLNHESLSTAIEKSFIVLEKLLPHCPVSPRMINIGGGFGIPYFAADTELDIKSVGKTLEQLLRNKKLLFKEAQFVVETGRYLIGEAGVYVAQVLYKKQSRGETFLVLDGGMHHHLAASGNLGQIIKKPYPMVLADRMDEEMTRPVNVVGPLCTPIDSFGKKVQLPHACIGDFLAVFCSGAYGYSSSPLGFLGHIAPVERMLP